MLRNTFFAPKNYIKNSCLWMVFVLLCISQTTLADGTGFIEVRADRVVLYPQRMELRGGETLKLVRSTIMYSACSSFSMCQLSIQICGKCMNIYLIIKEFYLKTPCNFEEI